MTDFRGAGLRVGIFDVDALLPRAGGVGFCAGFGFAGARLRCDGAVVRFMASLPSITRLDTMRYRGWGENRLAFDYAYGDLEPGGSP